MPADPNRESAPSPIRGFAVHWQRWRPILVTGALASSLLAYASIQKGTAPAISLSYRDKLEHLFTYAAFGILFYRVIAAKLPQKSFYWLLPFLVICLFGATDECLQHFNPSRTGDPLDWLADSIGALLGIFLYRNLSPVRCLSDWSPFLCLRRFLS